MNLVSYSLFLVLSSCLTLVSGHISIWHESMWGFNVTSKTFSYDNRPVAPLQEYTFNEWWFHNHLAYPPPDNTFMSLPAGGRVTTELACTKSATTLFASADSGGDTQDGNNPCPGAAITEYHTLGFDDLKGCALAITHNSDVNSVQPEDFAIFSVNHTCVWNRFTDFEVPEKMPACPEGGCICAWFWIHSADAGSEQIYMNGFRCDVTGATSTTPIAAARVPRRCGADPDFKKPNAAPWNCTYGAKQPLYWLQKERNNMFEGAHAPPFYLDLYAFSDGAQDDIFEDSLIPIFDEQGTQTGFTTRGKDTATTAAVVTPSATTWPTTTSTPPAQATQDSDANTAATGGSSSSAQTSSAASTPTSAAPDSSPSASSSSSGAAQPTSTLAASSKQCHLSAFSRKKKRHNKKRELWH